MALDTKARDISLNFTGGSLTATQGLLEALFGPKLSGAGETLTTKNVSVSGHSRVRVIGAGSKAISGNSYVRKRYPSLSGGGAAGGEPIALYVNDAWWTARLSGSHTAFCDFLKNATFTIAGAVVWKSERGTKYGPFGI